MQLRKFLTLGATRDGSTVSAYRRPMGYQQILHGAMASAVHLTVPTVAGTGYVVGYAVIQCIGGGATDYAAWRDDGTAPTSTTSMRLLSGQELDYSGDMTMIQFIVGSGTPDLNISYYA